jgi:streptogramin lyase
MLWSATCMRVSKADGSPAPAAATAAAPYKMTPAKLRLAIASMGKADTNVGELCAELGGAFHNPKPTRQGWVVTAPRSCRSRRQFPDRASRRNRRAPLP